MATKQTIKAILASSLGFATRTNHDLVGNIVALRPLRKEVLLKATTFAVSEKTLEKRFVEAKREVVKEASLEAINNSLISCFENKLNLSKFREDLSKLSYHDVGYKDEELTVILSNFMAEVKPEPLCQTVDVATYTYAVARLFDIV